MESALLNPARLPPGTQVGPWRVVNRLGMGTYGAVYLAVGTEHGETSPVALKLALYPRDARFAREGELLSRTRHPSVPRLWDVGSWQDARGTRYPYLAMELVEGESLYTWALAHSPSSRQVLQLLAAVARALEAVHAAGGVHRDVKGDNVLVREADGHAFLTDFGSGHYLCAATLTSPPFPPGTPAYRSPEAWRSVIRPRRSVIVPYAPGPADDVFALGVTAYRLVTQEYPAGMDPAEVAPLLWHLGGTEPRSPRAINPRCCAELDALITRMLSLRAETRGSARELAAALERAGRRAGHEADASLFLREAPASEGIRAPPPPHAHRELWRRPLAAASLGAALTLGVRWMLHEPTQDSPAEAQSSADLEAQDGGTVAVGDSVLTAPVQPIREPFAWSTISMDVPPQPLRGQTRPDATGRCPSKVQVPINGGCWMKLAADLKSCDVGNYVYKGACYAPVFQPPRPATSSPANHTGSP
ncbi:serine/threonine protein kinase [Pyxidicoccus sp. 3LG]